LKRVTSSEETGKINFHKILGIPGLVKQLSTAQEDRSMSIQFHKYL